MPFFLKKLAYLMVLLMAAELSAQEKAETPSRKTQAAVEKSSLAPSAAGKASPEPDRAAEPRLGPAVKRDPFRPFTLNVRAATRRRENLAPLERFELGQLKLVAIIWDIKEPKAMVEDSAGLGYVVKVGTPMGVNDGKVAAINPGAVTVEEFFVDLYGAKKKQHVEMRLSVEKSE